MTASEREPNDGDRREPLTASACEPNDGERTRAQ